MRIHMLSGMSEINVRVVGSGMYKVFIERHLFLGYNELNRQFNVYKEDDYAH